MVSLSFPPWPALDRATCSRTQWNREKHGWMDRRIACTDRRRKERGLILVFQIGRVGREGFLVSFLLPVAWFPLPTYIQSYIHPTIHLLEGALVAFLSLLTLHTKIPHTYSINTSITMCMADWLPRFSLPQTNGKSFGIGRGSRRDLGSVGCTETETKGHIHDGKDGIGRRT